MINEKEPLPILTESNCLVRINQYYDKNFGRKLTEQEVLLVLLTYRILRGGNKWEVLRQFVQIKSWFYLLDITAKVWYNSVTGVGSPMEGHWRK